jgi:hypothetical protein
VKGTSDIDPKLSTAPPQPTTIAIPSDARLLTDRQIRERWGPAVPNRITRGKRIAEGTFSAPVRISRDRVCWWSHELEAHFANLPRAVEGWREQPRRHTVAAKAKMRVAWAARKAAWEAQGAPKADPDPEADHDQPSRVGAPSAGPGGGDGR